MEVYRIVFKKWATTLGASGNAARWNSAGNKVIYTAASRALACLENIVHRGGKGLNEQFKVMVIHIPASVKTDRFEISDLPDNWFEMEHYETCRQMGDQWLIKKTSAVLRVPSAIIFNEYNFLLNPEHRDFKKIRLKRTEDFKFDPRISVNAI